VARQELRERAVAKFGERYELIRRVGAGGMAEVWLAHDEQLAGRPVAIKIMHKHMLPNEDDVARFEREMRFAALMAHPNIVTVYTTGTCDGAPFLVMEFLRGHDLEKALPGADPERIAGIGRDICGGLAYAHREGVIHRDIKPANLFLCESGQVKITDFGVARAVGETALSSAVLVGTFAYMPPERWRGEPSAVSGDVWAAGCVLYRLICGRTPRLLPDVGHYAAAATRGEPVPDLRDIADVPDWLAGPVMAMLADDPAQRPTAAECVRALSTTWFTTPAHGLPAHGPHLPIQFGHHQALTGVTGGAAGEDPVTTPVARPAGARTAAGRSRRLNRTSATIGGTALLLLAGSLTAWRLGTSPPVTGAAAGGSTPGASHAAAAVAPAGARPAPGSGSSSATSPPAPTSAAPGASRPGSAAGSSSSSPTETSSASPATSASSAPADSSGSASSGTPTADPTDSATDSGTPLVPVPDVTGMNFAQAQRVLQSDGFTVVGNHNPPGDKVTSESPSGEAPEGSVITLVYGS
jgi:serine/threonine protein kinase